MSASLGAERWEDEVDGCPSGCDSGRTCAVAASSHSVAVGRTACDRGTRSGSNRASAWAITGCQRIRISPAGCSKPCSSRDLAEKRWCPIFVQRIALNIASSTQLWMLVPGVVPLGNEVRCIISRLLSNSLFTTSAQSSSPPLPLFGLYNPQRCGCGALRRPPRGRSNHPAMGAAARRAALPPPSTRRWRRAPRRRRLAATTRADVGGGETRPRSDGRLACRG